MTRGFAAHVGRDDEQLQQPQLFLNGRRLRRTIAARVKSCRVTLKIDVVNSVADRADSSLRMASVRRGVSITLPPRMSLCLVRR